MMHNQVKTPRQRVAAILDPDGNSFANRIVNGILMIVIIVSLLAIIAESALDNDRSWSSIFQYIEHIAVFIFFVEYVLRIWSCVDLESWADKHPFKDRLLYALKPMVLIDLLAILPYFLAWFLPGELLLLRTLRLLRVFKLTRYSRSMQVLIEVLRNEAATFGASLFMMVILVIIAASGMYVVERDVQPEAFGSIPQAMWWAMITLTTVGYGDVVPATGAGKILAAAITIIGVGMVALPAGILASGFGEHIRRSRSVYSNAMESALADGIIDEQERKSLDQLSEKLGLSDKDVQEFLEKTSNVKRNKPHRCPHCGESIATD